MIAGLAAGLAIQPMARAATPMAQIETDADAALKAVTYDHHAGPVREEHLRNYAGPKTLMTDEMLAMNWSDKKWRNAAVCAAALMAETEQFIQERTR